MSAEIVNLFTSSKNINYLIDEISKHIKDTKIKEAVLDTLTESVFEFQSHALLENSGQKLRHSINNKYELDRLNHMFINDRLSFAKNFNIYAEAQEYYADQMFIDDSLRPGAYDKLNDERIFRYQDDFDPNRSKIPVWQINRRGNTDYNNDDELRESEVSQVRSATEEVKNEFINDLPINKPKWMDII